MVKRWIQNKLFDLYNPVVGTILTIGFAIALAILGLSLFFAVFYATPQPAPAYRAVPTVTIAPTVGGCIRFDTAPEYYTTHPNVTPCGG